MIAEDLTNKEFGELKVICRGQDYISPNGVHAIRWLCKCSCDNFTAVSTGNLKNGSIKSCGLCKKGKGYIDLTGKQFNRLKVIKRDEFKKQVSWICICDCKKIVSVQGSSLKNGSTKSCGCLRQENKLDRTVLIGQKYNEWEIIGVDDKNNDYVLCRCSCGIEKRVSLFNLINESSKSCGHVFRNKRINSFEDLTNKTFGRLTVLSRATNGSKGQRRWLCQCKCGNTVEVLANSLKNHNTTSCGCYSRQRSAIFISSIEREFIRFDK